MNRKPQQRGQIHFYPWSILKYPGSIRDILTKIDEKGNFLYIRLNNGQIVKNRV